MRAFSIVLSVLFAASTYAESSKLQKQAEVANSVGLRLIKEASLAQSQKGELKNTLVSGVSAYAALSLLAGGLQGRTATDLNQYLDVQSLKAFDADSSAYLNFLSRKPNPNEKTFQTKPTIGIYNSAWSTNGKTTGRPFRFAKGFSSRLQTTYASDISDGEFDFKSKKAADAMNAWADAKTNHLIPQILDANAVAELVWVLMNATYFEGEWGVSFHKLAATRAPQFTSLDGKISRVDSIQTTTGLSYFADARFESVEVPFVGRDLSFVVALPKSNAIYKESIRSGTTYSVEFWSNLLAELSKSENLQEVQLTMPKFTFDYAVEMKKDEELTKAVGLNFLYSTDISRLTDFAPMGTPESPVTSVGLIKQASKIELDEKGVKAAAVTVIGGLERAAVFPQANVIMNVDRPFVFAIVEKKTKSLLFVGTLTQP